MRFWIATAAINAALPHGVLLERAPPRGDEAIHWVEHEALKP